MHGELEMEQGVGSRCIAEARNTQTNENAEDLHFEDSVGGNSRRHNAGHPNSRSRLVTWTGHKPCTPGRFSNVGLKGGPECLSFKA